VSRDRRYSCDVIIDFRSTDTGYISCI